MQQTNKIQPLSIGADAKGILLYLISQNQKLQDEIKAHEQSPTFVCPHCGSAMEVIEVLPHMYLPRAPPLRLH